MAALPPPELNEDVIRGILLRLTPEEPSYLVRASLVCKLWRSIVSDRIFLRCYRRLHHTPPLLGFFDDNHLGTFVPITEAAVPFSKEALDWRVLDCHHGRVFLQHRVTDNLIVWDPITGEREQVPAPNVLVESVLCGCAAADCDHCDCHGGPFLVVVVCMGTYGGHGVHDDGVDACVYSSRVGTWGDLVSVHDVDVNYYWDYYVNLRSGAIVGDEV